MSTRHELDVTPAEFARFMLGLPLYGWQERILTALDRSGRYSFRCCNESGKTTTIFAAFVLWFLTMYPKGEVVATAGVFRQVVDQLFPAIRRLAGKLEGWEVLDSTLSNGRGGFGRGFRAVDPKLFEGYHAHGPDAPLAILVDEAKSVDDGIFTGVERCRPTWLLVASSPGDASGEFYRSQTTQRHFWTTFPPVTAYDCPHISAATIQATIDKYGRDHWLVRSMIFAEFTRQSEAGAVVALSDAERAVQTPPPFVRGDGAKRGFCDFAAGGDENVFAIREGNCARVVAAWRERDTMAACDAFCLLFEREGFDKLRAPEELGGDVGGLGVAMLDALKERGWDLSRFNFGAPAYDANRFSSRGSEIWNEFGADLRRGEWILEDATERGADTLLAQLSGRKGRRDTKGRLALEDKDAMKARGLDSPDRADAIIAACCTNPAPFFLYT